MGAEAISEATIVEAGVTGAGGLVSIRTNGIGSLESKVELPFLISLGSGVAGFGSVATLEGGQDRSSSVSASLRDRSMMKAEPALPTKTEGARGCGGGNSKSISLRVSSSVFREARVSGRRL